MTPNERDKLLERLAEAMVDHAETSAQQHADLRVKVAEMQATLGQIREAQRETLGAAVTLLIRQSTATPFGTVALLALIAILALTLAAVALGSDQVLSILAGNVRLSAASDTLPAPETP
ncbi:MAG: hypothetical protein EBZ93_11245 [Actinobacteria bacterium]|jgi:hypothetical protein|nr:hypothetical protein [Actinomycetota bacterium]